MRITVLENKKQSSFTTCIYKLLEKIGQQQGYEIKFADSLNNTLAEAGKCISFITLRQASFIHKLIQQQQLKAFIKTNKTDLLVQNASSFIVQKKAPQLFIADNIEKLPAVKKLSYSKIFLLTYSQFAKQAIIDKGFTNIVHVVPLFAEDLFQPITWSMKQQVKIDYTEGREYFFVSNNFKNIDHILKFLRAFSGFKKWQQSSMKLVIAGRLYVPPGDWEEKLSTYKYKEDILLCNQFPDEEKAKLLAGAYACIHLPQKENDLLPLLQAMQCQTPLITLENAGVKEYAYNATLTAQEDNYEELTQQMILMYKDENRRNELIENCAARANEFSKEKAMQALQNIIL